MERYGARYSAVMETVKDAQDALRRAQEAANKAGIKEAEHALSLAKETKDVLDTFKKNLKSFCRYYEFISQVVDFRDEDLEKLSVYAAHLLPLLREEQIKEDIDLSEVVMTHYKLDEVRQQRIVLEPGKAGYVTGVTALGGHNPKEQEYERLSQIIERLNDLFAGDVTEGDMVSFVDTLATKVAEDEAVMAQIRNNTKEQAMLGDYPSAVERAVIASMEAHNDLSMQFLTDPRVSKGIAELLLDMLKKGLQSELRGAL